MPESRAIEQSSWLHWLPPRRVAIVETDAHVRFKVAGTEFELPSESRPILDRLMSRGWIRFEDLGAAALPDAARIVKDLVSAGLVALVEQRFPRGALPLIF